MIHMINMTDFFLTLDLDENRLNMAKKLGADYVIKVDTTAEAKEMAKKARDCLGRVDRSIECTGAESSIRTAIYVCLSQC